MATRKKTQEAFPVREPNADDAIDLIGIIAAAGGGEQMGAAIGFGISAFQGGDGEMVTRAASTAITDGLHAALRDPNVRLEAKGFLFRIWNPKLSVGEGEDVEAKKREAWEKLPMRAIPEIVNNFRKTDGFSDFLAFFSDLVPRRSDSTTEEQSEKSPSDS